MKRGYSAGRTSTSSMFQPLALFFLRPCLGTWYIIILSMPLLIVGDLSYILYLGLEHLAKLWITIKTVIAIDSSCCFLAILFAPAKLHIIDKPMVDSCLKSAFAMLFIYAQRYSYIGRRTTGWDFRK